ncbi:uncharacterized protein LY89DRAFT_252365 [Mollisia scopiformis]|uniref:Peptidase S53 activation domain-containing protein n=1 Tax=Mollisia scopiformis TaxID=149040 RepID=A0A194WSK2_MOLSC|nr:uncharacterized protein LY89DRAFT_252365 [Mollisia scopiformis]KUJ10926.1 hypothetical protein LY89DRAFT_252365 [Mollisia scopiformis]
MDVSDPSSSNYGKHWTPEKVVEAFAPSKETIDEVKAWLVASGIADTRLSLSNRATWIRVNATIDEAENLLKTNYKEFEHTDSGKTTLACHEYSVPKSLKHHIDIITPTVHFAVMTNEKAKRGSDQGTRPSRQVQAVPMADPPTLASSSSAFNYSICSTITYPQCIRALYNMPVGTMDK